MRIETWIPDSDPNCQPCGTASLITVDTDDVWLETFVYWDARVPTDTAAAIASATVKTLIQSQQTEANV